VVRPGVSFTRNTALQPVCRGLVYYLEGITGRDRIEEVAGNSGVLLELDPALAHQRVPLVVGQLLVELDDDNSALSWRIRLAKIATNARARPASPSSTKIVVGLLVLM
jgi:hypothetical protein